MNKMDLLIKSIILLFKESNNGLSNPDHNSKDVVTKVLASLKEKSKFRLHGGENELIDDLKILISRMLNNKDEDVMSLNSLIETLGVILEDRPEIFMIVKNSLNREFTDISLLDYLADIRRTLRNYLKDKLIAETLSRYKYQYETGKDIGDDRNVFLTSLILELENINEGADDDAAITDEVSFDKIDTLNEQVEASVAENKPGGKFQFGLQGLNRMFQKGISRGEYMNISALQHKYKSGVLATLFAQVLMYNKPQPPKEEGKKPTAVFCSLEDSLPILFGFLYKYLYFDEHGELPDYNKVSNDEITEYIHRKLTANGWEVKIFKVNPSDWTYKHLFDKMASYEAMGLEIQFLVVDYLSLIPTTGCRKDGPMGTDLRDLVRRVRNYIDEKAIAFLTAHQLSSDAKQHLRVGTPDSLFPKEIANKGYYSGSKQLDQEFAAAAVMHIAKMKGISYLVFQREKHRGAGIIDDEDLYCMIPFPKGAPIPSDVNKEDSTYDPNKRDDDSLDGLDF